MATPYPDPEHRPFVFGSSRRKALLVHGFPGTPAELRPLGERLADRGWEAHGVLLPGFGPQIASLGDHRWSDWKGAVETALRGLREDADELVLHGHSMGGALALVVAAGTVPPDRLLLSAPFSRLADRRAMLLPLLRFVVPRLHPYRGADFDDPEVRRGIARLLPDADLDDPGVRTELEREVAMPTVALEQVRRVGRAAQRGAAAVTVPTFVVQGRNDTTVRFADTRRLVGRFGGPVAYREIPGGHDMLLPGREGHEAFQAFMASAIM